MGTEFTLTKQEGEGQAKEAEDRKDPHSEIVAGRVIGAGMAVIVGPAHQEIETRQTNVLDHCHQAVGGA